MAEIATNYGVTRQRMMQVIKRTIPDWKFTYGRVVKRREAAEQWRRKWGQKDATDLYQAQRAKFRQKKANTKGIPWDLDFGDIYWPTHCPILGMELDYHSAYRAENSPSFDQVDPGKGYTKGNVQILSWRANRIKNDGSAEEHRKIAEWLSSITTSNDKG